MTNNIGDQSMIGRVNQKKVGLISAFFNFKAAAKHRGDSNLGNLGKSSPRLAHAFIHTKKDPKPSFRVIKCGGTLFVFIFIRN
jgi:hypothetical protein